MSFWVIFSWLMVCVLTGINVFIFLKLKQASEQMLRTAFPGAKDMNEAVAQMQKMMGGMGGRGGFPGMGGQRGGANPDAQLKNAMEMLKRIQNEAGGKR